MAERKCLALVAVAVALLGLLVPGVTSLGCIGANGHAVDWFVAYKLPHNFNYAYYDASSSALEMAKGMLSDSQSPVQKTLEQVHETDKYGLAAYNDEEPDGAKHGNGGHAKGVLASNTQSGFWLVHSLPSFPNLSGDNMWDDAAYQYGQSFLCLSVSADAVNGIAGQILKFAPHVYDYYMPEDVGSKFPNFKTLATDQRLPTPQDTSKYTFNVGSLVLTSFAKAPSWGKDLYEDFVEPTLNVKAGFAWETWRRSPYLPSYCPLSTTPWLSVNVQELQIGSTSFKYTLDHSKWGVSLDSDNPYVCIGGINRMQSQRARGGGTVCVANPSLFEAMSDIITMMDDPCSTELLEDYSSETSEHDHTDHTVIPVIVGIVSVMALVVVGVVWRSRSQSVVPELGEHTEPLIQDA